MATSNCWQTSDRQQKEAFVDRRVPARDIHYTLQRLKAWQVQGQLSLEASALKEELKSRTNDVNFLAQISPKNPLKVILSYEVYLVGKYDDVDELRLALVAECLDIKYARRAWKLLENLKKRQLAGLLDAYELHYMQGYMRLTADSDSSSHHPEPGNYQVQTLCGKQIIIGYSNDSQFLAGIISKPTTSTIGGVISIDGKHYALTAAHAFPQRGLANAESPLRQSHYVHAQDCTPDQIDKDTLGVSDVLLLSPNRINYRSGSVIVNRAQDWALVPVEHDKYIGPNFVVCPDGSTSTVKRVSDATDIPTDKVLFYTGLSVPSVARFSPNPSLLLIPGCTGLQNAWKAPKSSLPGDSGSWVIDTDGTAHAMIIAASQPEASVYCLPLAPILQSVKNYLNSNSTPGIPQGEDLDPKPLDLSSFPEAEYAAPSSSDPSNYTGRSDTSSEDDDEGVNSVDITEVAQQAGVLHAEHPDSNDTIEIHKHPAIEELDEQTSNDQRPDSEIGKVSEMSIFDKHQQSRIPWYQGLNPKQRNKKMREMKKSGTWNDRWPKSMIRQEQPFHQTSEWCKDSRSDDDDCDWTKLKEKNRLKKQEDNERAEHNEGGGEIVTQQTENLSAKSVGQTSKVGGNGKTPNNGNPWAPRPDYEKPETISYNFDFGDIHSPAANMDDDWGTGWGSPGRKKKKKAKALGLSTQIPPLVDDDKGIHLGSGFGYQNFMQNNEKEESPKTSCDDKNVFPHGVDIGILFDLGFSFQYDMTTKSVSITQSLTAQDIKSINQQMDGIRISRLLAAQEGNRENQMVLYNAKSDLDVYSDGDGHVTILHYNANDECTEHRIYIGHSSEFYAKQAADRERAATRASLDASSKQVRFDSEPSTIERLTSRTSNAPHDQYTEAVVFDNSLAPVPEVLRRASPFSRERIRTHRTRSISSSDEEIIIHHPDSRYRGDRDYAPISRRSTGSPVRDHSRGKGDPYVNDDYDKRHVQGRDLVLRAAHSPESNKKNLDDHFSKRRHPSVSPLRSRSGSPFPFSDDRLAKNESSREMPRRSRARSREREVIIIRRDDEPSRRYRAGSIEREEIIVRRDEYVAPPYPRERSNSKDEIVIRRSDYRSPIRRERSSARDDIINRRDDSPTNRYDRGRAYPRPPQVNAYHQRRLMDTAYDHGDIVSIPKLSYEAAAGRSRYSRFRLFEKTRRISRTHVDLHALDAFDIQWEWDPRDDFYIRIPHHITDEVLEDLKYMSKTREVLKQKKAETRSKLQDGSGRSYTQRESSDYRERRRSTSRSPSPAIILSDRGRPPIVSRQSIVLDTDKITDGEDDESEERRRKLEILADTACLELDLTFEEDLQILLRKERIPLSICQRLISFHRQSHSMTRDLIAAKREAHWNSQRSMEDRQKADEQNSSVIETEKPATVENDHVNDDADLPSVKGSSQAEKSAKHEAQDRSNVTKDPLEKAENKTSKIGPRIEHAPTKTRTQNQRLPSDYGDYMAWRRQKERDSDPRPDRTGKRVGMVRKSEIAKGKEREVRSTVHRTTKPRVGSSVIDDTTADRDLDMLRFRYADDRAGDRSRRNAENRVSNTAKRDDEQSSGPSKDSPRDFVYAARTRPDPTRLREENFDSDKTTGRRNIPTYQGPTKAAIHQHYSSYP